jgi:hypothetical protein
MADAYLFQASLLCADCGRELEISIDNDPVCRVAHRGDSDVWPQGPYPYGGGEADTPQHCDACHAFLDNPLTGDGYNYVREAIRDYLSDGRGRREVLRQWAEFYKDENPQLDRTIAAWQRVRPGDWR